MHPERPVRERSTRKIANNPLKVAQDMRKHVTSAGSSRQIHAITMKLNGIQA
jgi:hypothetical protein